jgi:hypothetical protein
VGAQPLAVQASQQLEKPVVQVLPLLGAAHLAALDFTEHVVRPLAVVRQHVTHPGGRPQVERVTHFFTAEAQYAGNGPFMTACSMAVLAQRMKALRLPPSQGQFIAMVARTAALAASSPGSEPQRIARASPLQPTHTAPTKASIMPNRQRGVVRRLCCTFSPLRTGDPDERTAGAVRYTLAPAGGL